MKFKKIKLAVLALNCLLYFFGNLCIPTPAYSDDNLKNANSLRGHFLVASEKIPDIRFEKTVILLVDHDKTGATGFIINKIIGRGSLTSFLKGFGVKTSASVSNKREIVGLYFGGPVEIDTAIVLHSPDYAGASTKRISDRLSWSNRSDILNAIASGGGPKKRIFLVGYSGWSAGKLEQEISRDSWRVAPADVDLIFESDPGKLWNKIVSKAGIKL